MRQALALERLMTGQRGTEGLGEEGKGGKMEDMLSCSVTDGGCCVRTRPVDLGGGSPRAASDEHR